MTIHDHNHDGTHGALRNPKPGIMQVTISIRLSKTLHAFVHTPRVGMLGRNVPTGRRVQASVELAAMKLAPSWPFWLMHE